MSNDPVTLDATRPSDPHLASFPRPANDNGRSLHFILDAAEANVEGYAPWLGKLQMKWTTVYAGDELQVTRVAKYLLDTFGIVSNLRVYASGDHPKAPDFWAKLAERCVAENIPPYIQIFNEPEDGREGFNDPDHFARLWGLRAEAVAQAGGLPGLQVLSEEFIGPVLEGASDLVKQRLYFSLHNYGANHPPAYPYPGKTVFEDDTAVLRFIAIADWFKKRIGFVPPMIGGEGGWLYQNADDKSMPPVGIDEWVAWHSEMYDWFRTGVLSNGDALPDYLFSVCPWLLFASNWYSDSWVNGLDADKKMALLDQLGNSTPYVRKFGSQAPPKPDQGGPVVVTPGQPGGQTQPADSQPGTPVTLPTQTSQPPPSTVQPQPADTPPPTQSPQGTQPEVPANAPAGKPTTYVVQGGDNLTWIAEKFGVTVSALVQANQLANPNLIRPGQTLKIPPV